MRRITLFVLAVLAMAALTPLTAQAGHRRTIRSAQERILNIADNSVDVYCSRYDCSNMDRGAPYWAGHPYRNSYGYGSFGTDYGYYRGNHGQMIEIGRQFGHRVFDQVQGGQQQRANQEFMLLDRCSSGSQEACDLLAGINPKKYGHMRSQPAPVHADQNRNVQERTERRIASRPGDNADLERSASRPGGTCITNLTRYTAVVFDNEGNEIAEVPGNGKSSVSGLSESVWAALNVNGVWCETTLTKNGPTQFTVNKVTSCTKVVVQ